MRAILITILTTILITINNYNAMAWENLKAAVSAIITTNGNNEITGALLEALINDNIIEQLGANEYKGMALPATVPGTPQSNVFYTATQAGTYTGFSGLTVDAGITLLRYNGSSWVKDVLYSAASFDNKTDRGGYAGTSQDLYDAIVAAVFTGAMSYQTLVLLNSVTPVPAEGTPARVVNDPDPNNNGNYSVSGGAWVKDATIESAELVTVVSGREIAVGSFIMYINEVDVTIPSTTKTLPPSDTFYIGYDLVDYTLHHLRRNYQDGMIWVAKVTTNTTSVVNIEQITPVLPVEKIVNFKNKLVQGIKNCNVALLGDSLVEGGAGGGVSWIDKLFDFAQGGYGYNIPNLAGLGDVDNYAVGGQTSHHGLMWCGKATKSGNGNFSNTALSQDNVAQIDAYDYTGFKTLKNTPLFTKDYDLVIIGYGANGGTNKLGYLENVVKLIREQGIDVILCTQNFRSAGGGEAYYDEGIILKRIADAYGAALADTWSFMKEAELDGTPVLFDIVHPNDEGKTTYANSFRTIISNVQLPTVYNYVSPNRLVKELTTSSWTAKNFINYSEIDCHPAVLSAGATMIASTIPDFKNPAVQFAGLDPALSVIELEVGEYATFAHAYAAPFSVIYDASMVGEFQCSQQNGTSNVGAAFEQTGFTGNSAKLAEISPMIGAGTHIASKSIRVTCTSGTVKIYGIMWHTYKNRTISLDDLKYRGTWLENTWSYSHPRSKYTDTLDDSVSFTFKGSQAIVYLSKKSAAGIVDVYLNGEIVNADLDLYSSGTFLLPVLIDSSNDDFYDTPVLENTVTIRLKGVNGSAAAPSGTNRRLMVIMIKEFDKR